MNFSFTKIKDLQIYQNVLELFLFINYFKKIIEHRQKCILLTQERYRLTNYIIRSQDRPNLFDIIIWMLTNKLPKNWHIFTHYRWNLFYNEVCYNLYIIDYCVPFIYVLCTFNIEVAKKLWFASYLCQK